jgi:phosphotransferase system enzyme I (PtsI)
MVNPQARTSATPPRYKGESIAAGIALGPVWLQGYDEAEGFVPRIPGDQVEAELQRLRGALAKSRVQIEELKQKHEGQLGHEERRIFDTHIAYLQDPMFLSQLEKLVRDERFSVRAAIRQVVANYERIFQLVEDEYLRLRAGDFRDVATRVLRNLDEQNAAPQPRPQGRYVLAARRLTTTDMFSFDNELVEGIVAEEGGISSHAAILARSMGIPTVTGIRDLPSKLVNGDFVVLDGSLGEVLVNPGEELRADYRQRAERHRAAHLHGVREERDHTTRDGTRVRILASCGNVGEVNLARSFGMDGIGLFRTELLFLTGKKVPAEDALLQQYREVARQPADQPVHFRLLDVGSGAGVPGLAPGPERNPALGLRGVRALLEEGSILRLQVRAILRAAAGTSQTAVLVPFVTGNADIVRVKQAIVEERLALRKRKEPCAETLAVAPVIEVPAAALTLKALLDDADFAVIAIDDLQAHLMAADRDTARVKDQYSMLHPALFELLARMARECLAAEKRLVLFGEGAADPLRVPFYLGVGMTEFSVAPVRLNGLLKVLKRFTVDECQRIANAVLEAPRPLDVQRVLVQHVE